ncbi:uncharacterized protein TEOVI_000152600 [Trypanosoma equiperdum]|uniref:Uncharacterized protein n=1 Tax=Trypanosoma equiperdum TaxID=5694 RepID=A0A1G4ICR4_TRYEQ|nr:hypothetical protein, conserved [Trypanosoma equiperdum]
MNSEEGRHHTLSSFLASTLESHVRSIRQEALTVCINHAQCELLSRRLQQVYNTLRKLPNGAPTPQLLTVFASADMLVQRMRHGGWLLLLERHLTCRALFAALFERIPCVWQLQMTDSWLGEDLLAVRADEQVDARVYLEKLGGWADVESRMDRARGSFDSSSGEESDAGETRGGAPPDALTEQDVIDMFRRQTLSRWRVPLEDLTPPGEDVLPPPYADSELHVFSLYNGYRYGKTPVLLYQLEQTAKRTIPPTTVTNFVQDMVARARWCHPNLVPFTGAFTEKVPFLCQPDDDNDCDPDVDTSSQFSGENSSRSQSANGCGATEEDVTAADDGGVDPSSAPVLDLGYMIEDMKYLKAELLNEESPYLTSYVVREVDNYIGNETFKTLHEVLFVERRPFTVREAIAITLQVADALQYILMEEGNMPEEVLDAWTVVSPSNIYVCPITVPRRSQHECCHEPGEFGGSAWPTCDDGYGDIQEEYDHDMVAPPFCGSSVQQRRCVELFAPGGWAAMYNPPVYVDGGPYSRWRPHPHASCRPTYAMAQLLLALVNNEPPYRLLTKQEELARHVFEADNMNDDDNVSVSVRVSIPVGSIVPRRLPVALRKLCSHAMHLRDPHRRGEAWDGLSLSDFRNLLWESYISLSNSMDTAGMLPGMEDDAQATVVPVGERVEMGFSRESSVTRERAPGPTLDDYGEFPSRES